MPLPLPRRTILGAGQGSYSGNQCPSSDLMSLRKNSDPVKVPASKISTAAALEERQVRHWLKMGCGSSHHAVEKDLRSKHETQASAAIRPAYLKPTTDALGLSNEQFEMATRVFLHFDEVRRVGCCRTPGSHTFVGPHRLVHAAWLSGSHCIYFALSESCLPNPICHAGW